MDGRIKGLMTVCAAFRQKHGYKFKPGFGMGSVEKDGTIHIHCGFHSIKSDEAARELASWPPFTEYCRKKGIEYELATKANRLGAGIGKSSEYRNRTEVTARLKEADKDKAGERADG